MSSPLKDTIKAIMYAPKCSVCKGTGLTPDELNECEACSGYGRGEGLFRKMIERVIAQTKEHEESKEPPRTYRIEEYRKP